MEEQNIATRLKLFMDSQGISSSHFADCCGIARPSMSQLLGGRNKKISNMLIESIHKAFPEISIMWLMFGEGDMLISGSSERDGTDNTGDVKPEYNMNVSALFPNDNPKNNSDLPNELNEFEITPAYGYKASSERLAQRIVELEKENKSLAINLEKEIKQKRRVESITIYYDDSTFEVFRPE